VICRSATPDDIPWLIETSLAAYHNVFAPLLPHLDWSSFGASFFEERFGRAWQKVRIASHDDRPIGFSLMTDSNIDMLFVAEGRRSAGCGRALLHDAEARGAKTLECFSINMAARRFYERHDWKLAEAYARPYAGAECTFVRYEKTSHPKNISWSMPSKKTIC
jgi:putative acetyltransferase